MNHYRNTNPFGAFSGRQRDRNTETYDAEGRRIRKKFSSKKMFPVFLVILLLVVGMNSYYMLDEENYAVVTTLGNPTAVSQAGLHFKIPFIQRVRKVSKVIAGMSIGYDQETGDSIEDECIMITKDFNFVDTDFYLEYKVSDPVKYLYASENPVATLKMLAQSYIRDTVGIYNVDDVITTGKAAIQSEIMEKLSARMIEEDIGLAVEKVTIQDAFPPTAEVLSAFKNVENAKQGKETAINNANKERNEKIPAAEAECDQIIKDAEAEKQARINEAQGQVSRFEQMYAEYTKYPLITKQRMFYETMEEVLPRLRLYIVDENGTQKLLPLDGFGSANTAASQTREENTAGREGTQKEQSAAEKADESKNGETAGEEAAE